MKMKTVFEAYDTRGHGFCKQDLWILIKKGETQYIAIMHYRLIQLHSFSPQCHQVYWYWMISQN